MNIIERSSTKKKDAKIIIIPDDTKLWYLEYKTHIENKPLEVLCDWNYLRDKIHNWNSSISNLILTSDYIIDKDVGWQGEPYLQRFLEIARKYQNIYKNNFELLEKLKWIDKSNILIYKNKFNYNSNGEKY